MKALILLHMIAAFAAFWQMFIAVLDRDWRAAGLAFAVGCYAMALAAAYLGE